MNKLAGGLAAAAFLAAAAPAGAAVLYDFENFAIGTHITGAELGGPWRFLYVDGTVVDDPLGVNGHVLQVNVLEPYGYAQLNISGAILGHVHYSVFIDSIDVLAPDGGEFHGLDGEVDVPADDWLTTDLAGHTSGYRSFRVYASDVYIDNIEAGFHSSITPEPAAWALMILGFGLAGAQLRRPQAARARA